MQRRSGWDRAPALCGPKQMQVNYAQVKAAKEMKETPVFWNLLFVRYI